jgi:hypothetical protein
MTNSTTLLPPLSPEQTPKNPDDGKKKWKEMGNHQSHSS